MLAAILLSLAGLAAPEGAQATLTHAAQAEHAEDPQAYHPTLPVRRRPNTEMHPKIPLRDATGAPVSESGRPLSFAQSCGGDCHDTAYIAGHSYHSWLGADEPAKSGEPFDRSAGAFGRWDPLSYRRISPPGEARPDLDLEGWLARFGAGHAGGGPAAALGGEMSCLVCHSEKMNEAGRAKALAAGQLAWVNTASLPEELVEQVEGGWRYKAAVGANVTAAQLGLGEPSNQTCGRCHGVVPKATPVALSGRDPLRPDAASATGLVFSAARMRDSALNLQGKEKLGRSFDLHAERLVGCADCHHSLNNPTQRAESDHTRPAHLSYNPRRQTLSAFLKRPLHHFAKGDTAQGRVARKLSGSMRGCEDCHASSTGHAWLPYAERHFSAMRCESCHVPKIRTPILQTLDWTVLTSSATARVEYRGGSGADPAQLITPFTPALISRGDKLGPYNLVTSFYWLESEPERPVRLEDLKAALFTAEGHYQPSVLRALDADGDGALSEAELVLDTAAKVEAVKARLQAVGVIKPRLSGRVQPYGLHHSVTGGSFATRACENCHGEASQLSAALPLAKASPLGVTPKLVQDAKLNLPGRLERDARGAWRYEPKPAGVYLFGHDKSALLDGAGLLIILAVILGVLAHGGARLWTQRRRS